MFLFNFLLNTAVFFLLLNFRAIGQWYKTKQPIRLNPWLGYALPASLGLALTILDSLRLYFLYQLLLFVVAALVLTCLFSYLARKASR